MKKLIYSLVLLVTSLTTAFAQETPEFDPSKITIVRDSFGVPHIFAKTDAEVAYGLEWATAEDDVENAHVYARCDARQSRETSRHRWSQD